MNKEFYKEQIKDLKEELEYYKNKAKYKKISKEQRDDIFFGGMMSGGVFGVIVTALLVTVFFI